MTVYAYTRVSTLTQAEDGDSLETQVRQVLAYASSRALELNESNVFVERGQRRSGVWFTPSGV